jgi:hypothetical protein
VPGKAIKVKAALAPQRKEMLFSGADRLLLKIGVQSDHP